MDLTDHLRMRAGVNGDTDICWKAADRIEADAKVIAALREALHKLDRQFDDSGYGDNRIDFRGSFFDVRNTIRAALAASNEQRTEDSAGS